MRKIIPIAVILILILAVGYFYLSQRPREELIGSEAIGENAQILTLKAEVKGVEYTRHDIEYTREGRTFRHYFDPKLRPALDWIKENTPEDAVFLCWWDYGHMIRGYTERDAVIYAPSKGIMETVSSGRWDTSASGDFSTEQRIREVALALTTRDPKETLDIMKKYGAGYVFITAEDSAKSFAILSILGYDPSEYLVDWKPTEKAMETMLFKMLGHERVEGLNLLYSDEFVKIYGLE